MFTNNNFINHLSVWIVVFGLTGIFLSSCSDSVTDGDTEETVEPGYTMSFKTTGDDETEFLITEKDLMSGEISAEGEGIEQTGWRFYYPVGKTLFSSGYSVDNQMAGYTANESGEIVKKGEFIFENALEMFGKTDDEETLLAMEIPRSGFADRSLHFVDVQTVQVEKIVGTRIFENKQDSLVAWPTALQVRGDHLFIPFHKLDAKGYFTTPRPDTAFVAVYSYPLGVGAEPEKIIKDPRTSNIGVNGVTSGMIEADNGDLYSFSSGAEMAGFSPASSKPSGILRIKDGETEFDEDYFFNIEEATDGGKMFWFEYVGNNKAIARILTHDNGGPWAAFGRSVFNQKLVILDLVEQTVTEVEGVPLHAKRYSSPLLVEDGKTFMSIETESDAFVYQVDIENATAEKGAEIKGKTIKGFYKLY